MNEDEVMTMTPARKGADMAVRPPKTPMKPNRFEITIKCDSKSITHVCAAHEQAMAVDRIMRSYAKADPELVMIRRLGALPKPRVSRKKL